MSVIVCGIVYWYCISVTISRSKEIGRNGVIASSIMALGIVAINVGAYMFLVDNKILLEYKQAHRSLPNISPFFLPSITIAWCVLWVIYKRLDKNNSVAAKPVEMILALTPISPLLLLAAYFIFRAVITPALYFSGWL